MAFVYHQICQKIIPIIFFLFACHSLIFAKNDICLLTLMRKRSYSFTCGSCEMQTSVDIDTIASPGALQYIKEKKRELRELALVRKLKQEELRKLHHLGNLTKIEIQQIT